jgi:hypothetical protein
MRSRHNQRRTCFRGGMSNGSMALRQNIAAQMLLSFLHTPLIFRSQSVRAFGRVVLPFLGKRLRSGGKAGSSPPVLLGWDGHAKTNSGTRVQAHRVLAATLRNLDSVTPQARKGAVPMGGFLFRFILGGCRHKNATWPITLDDQTYTVCLGCAIKIPYSLERMAPLSFRECRELKRTQGKGLKASLKR